MGKRQHDWKLDFGRVTRPTWERKLEESRPIIFNFEGQAYKELMQVHDEEKGDHEEND